MILVIGGTSFIGMYTIDELVRHGKKVLATGRNRKLEPMVRSLGADYVELDITNEGDFSKLPTTDVEDVILLAALLPANAKADLVDNENAADYFQVNCIGTVNVLEYCRKNGIKRVISCCSYGDTSNSWGKGYAITEDEPRGFKFTGDHAMYVISKNAANDTIEYYNQQHGMQGASFRFPPVYGVGPHGTIMVNGKPYKSGIQTFIENAEQGKDIELWGDPHIKRDIIYVKDVARAFRLALASDETYGLYNMTSSTQLDLEDQAQAVIEVFGKGKGSRIVYRPDKPNNTPSFLYSMEKAKRDFGFVPKYTDYKTMMLDYQKELESGRWEVLVSADD
ncbi:NAD(P)-dependent oxidoreductase [Olsenella sp. Marseille-P4559]|uniref:NAD-dependent epimerase/dehydratase family protein n=1 Tax=Olsenella sp. Marseille-P4559 TaxID=2364795 RepID=UPI0010314E0E|nr:NAD(P)-dependent oxidoreductase [Olsenella sp. Marseille-P4559]